MRRGVVRKFWKTVCRIPGDDRGSILPIFAVLSVLVIVVAGAGVDYARAINEREAISTALDAAALTVATQLSTSVMTNDQISTALKDAFRANATNIANPTDAVNDLTFVVDAQNGLVTVSTKATVATTFLSVGGLGPDKLSVATETQVSYSKFDVELALVLDVTGSMSTDPSDLVALQKAAAGLVEELLPANQSSTGSKVRISIVPYSQGVNLGSYASKVTNGASSSKNCVTERGGDEKYTDAVYDYNSTSSEFFGGRSDYERQVYSPEKIYSNPGDNCPVTPVLPLTSSKSKLLDTITSLVGVGGTAGQAGISWGWYTLSPNWSKLWPNSSAPAAYGDKKTFKIAVIMTDGGFNMKYDKETVSGGCGWVYENRRWQYKCTTTQKWFQTWYPYSSYDTDPAVRGRKFCDAMSDAGIQVYTVFFETQDSNFGKDLMSYCATGKDKFYYASSSSELIAAFGNIAKKIQSIYLAK